MDGDEGSSRDDGRPVLPDLLGHSHKHEKTGPITADGPYETVIIVQHQSHRPLDHAGYSNPNNGRLWNVGCAAASDRNKTLRARDLTVGSAEALDWTPKPHQGEGRRPKSFGEGITEREPDGRNQHPKTLQAIWNTCTITNRMNALVTADLVRTA